MWQASDSRAGVERLKAVVDERANVGAAARPVVSDGLAGEDLLFPSPGAPGNDVAQGRVYHPRPWNRDDRPRRGAARRRARGHASLSKVATAAGRARVRREPTEPGNRLFPTQVAITPTSVVHYTPHWIGRHEHSINIAHVASVRIDTKLLFADVFIETIPLRVRERGDRGRDEGAVRQSAVPGSGKPLFQAATANLNP